MKAAFEWFNPAGNSDEQVSVVVRMSRDEAEALLGFDLNSATAPPAADSRAIARPVVASVQAARADGSFPVQS